VADYRTGNGQDKRYHRVQSHTPQSINSVQPNISQSDFGDVRVPNRSSHNARSAHARGYKQFSTYDTSAIRPKRSKIPKIIGIILAVAIVIAAIYGVVRFFDLGSGENPNMLPEGTSVTFTIESGENSRTIAQKLYDTRLINSKSSFTNEVKAQNAGSSLKAGTYTIVAGTSVSDIVKMITAGSNAMYVLTVPEGSVRTAIADMVKEATKGEVTAEQFLEATSNAAAWVGEFSFLSAAKNNNLEGYLYPETYYIDYGSTAQDIVRMMLKQFETVTSMLDFSYPTAAGLNSYQTLILTSIVEKEGTVPQTAHIAGVFYNRLTTEGTPTFGYLESDATTAYVVGREPTAEEVHADDPYSTYSNPGLPPTPICNPGLTAFHAICSPQVDNAFYFFSYTDSEGETQYVFSETLAEHEKYVEMYLR